MSFQNKVVIITGGGTGIGKEIARRFLARGASVVINGRRVDVLKQTAEELDPAGKRLAIAAGDIGQRKTSDQLTQTAVEQFGGVDVLINNAGIFKPTPFLDHREADFDAYINVILRGTFFAAQSAIPEMRKRGGGAIINVGSMWAIEAIGATPSSAYSAAKAGVHALTRNLAIEFAKDGIRVNAVAPAVVETPVYETFLTPAQIAEVLQGFHAFHPLGRNGQPADVAEAVLFLAGEQSTWITGAVLPLDGGVTAGRHR